MANPSRSNRAGWEKLVCDHCEERIYMNGPRAVGVMFGRDLRTEKDYALHGPCIRPFRREHLKVVR